MGGDPFEEVAHLVLLVDHVVAEEEPAFVEPRIGEIEELDVVALPGVDEDAVEWARQLGNLDEGSSGPDGVSRWSRSQPKLRCIAGKEECQALWVRQRRPP